jgi:hypothetical protein
MILKTHAQSNNNTETRKLGGPYHVVEVSSGIILNIVKGDTEEVSVTASNGNYRNKIKTVVKDGTLKVFFYYHDDPNWKGMVNSKETFRVTIHKTSLTNIQVSEGAHVNCQSQITSEQLDLKLITGGEFMGGINCKSLLVNMQDGSELKITGVTTDAEYKITGGSYADCKKLLTTNCKAEVYSSSKLYLNVTEKLDVLGKNRAEIYFKGSPSVIKKDLENSFLKHSFL